MGKVFGGENVYHTFCIDPDFEHQRHKQKYLSFYWTHLKALGNPFPNTSDRESGVPFDKFRGQKCHVNM